jgi:signal transduction histidine kinase
MMQMAELVKCAMQGVPLAQARGVLEGAGSMAEAAHHAVEVMMPLADERCARLSGEISDELSGLSGRFVFAILTNAIRNSIESIERSGRADGCIEVYARTEPGRTGRCVVIEVLDNGEGPPELPIRRGESVFRLGYSTKQGGTGVGLSVCRELVQELGGTIALTSRELEATTGRGGASLRVMFPIPRGDVDSQEEPRH